MIAETRERGLYKINEITFSHKRVNSTVIAYTVCFISDSCVNNAYKCNCDVNNFIETFDEGFLANNTKLPVTELQIGDLGNSGEAGWFTLGPLICSGQI